MPFEKTVLQGERVILEPLSAEHKQGLCDAINDGELWNLFFTLVPHVSRIDEFLAFAETRHGNGDGLAFAIIDRASGRVAGSSRFMRAEPAHRRVEIGFTFLGQSFQRTGINTEAKLLMLEHAFERLAMNRVEFITDFLNTGSRNAILGIGARQEGILRNHMVMPDGRVRDSVLFSMTNNEWPGIKRHLQFKLARRRA